ncbi:alpha-glucan family phosphorylase [Anabaena cylindrica FACHB-243]|uniref:glycogen phosphorylase n=1 Tax=Anabaena cylindrica (strain ATCC 27899 / PCC 7122) TaxID=272123 RepID=K9ZI08_ANACC|nr:MULTISPECIES: alpha-glucan family phosphorylase [Anabaena]AFZ57985.1 alpha-glucan phosphorylase [Anabaena cylindrica PCC 7122]MBD2420769.1 alpha-glucan family phosphorylase [Anabaena cylindrica FACHB-243]MBY5282716.1 glycosyltransferase family 1 protein [Anabaena sp. CCAP 1446/1C]MBY5307110.1 glycosyltransferase family 1 protein [Anabaena sp. CCAP 1446/1C]MCM2408211.1 alpha-glucan family phosphorylase [Anabaena sp. CCAP 1446/1C]
MQPIRTFNVSPSLPQRLEPLRKLAYNLHFDWNVESKDLFRRLDTDLWESSRHNPVLMLGTISQARLLEVVEDEGFLAQMDRAARQLEDYLQERTWYHKQRGQNPKECYAYFSAEFGLVDCLPVYSGGLGVLAGDHLKSASDLGLPLVGVGLLYQQGYFAQYLNADGWQQERYPINDFYNMPLHLERNPDGSELRIEVDYPGRKVYARVWRVQVGTVPLYMLDTNIEPNKAYDHDITDQLYGGDIDMRIHQEIMLGIGGVQMLKALGYDVTAYHMNEGHAAFSALERIRVLIQEEGLSYAQAKQVVSSSNIFTTHTPVPAGIDLFAPDKVLYYLGYYADIFGLPKEQFLGLGRENTGDLSGPFSMAVLALKMATFSNGVAQLHGVVSRQMFQGLWKKVPVEEVPIAAITNGVHARSCVAKSTQELYDRYLGPNWSSAPPDNQLWERMDSIPDEELWRNHERCRLDMVLYVREHLVKHLRDRGASASEIAQAQEVLDPNVLTIGFARRFATYKRATLWMRDLDRIKRILLSNKHRKVQFVIAGKAHPKDIPGKELIRDINHFIHEQNLEKQVVFVPNYDIHIARLMVAGCDIWLNTPRRPREASGTSGMKAAMNGLPNLSVLDGWWDEADYVRTGWAIGHGENYEDPNYQDEVEANALYELLEKEVVPLFYDHRDEDGLPRPWVAKMKDAIRLNCPFFNTARMVREYAQRAYFPASDRYHTLTVDNYAPAKELAAWKAKLGQQWFNIKIKDIDVSAASDIEVNQTVAVKAKVDLATLKKDDVRVELYQGSIDANGDIVNAVPVVMDYQGEDNQGLSIYTVDITYTTSGLQGLSLRVLPQNPYLSSPYEPRLIAWAE